MNKRFIRLTEGDLHRIVKESMNKVLKEDANDDNAVIDAIGQEILPMVKTFNKLQLIYGRYLDQYIQNPTQRVAGYNFMGRFARAFKDAANGINTMEFIYNH